MGDVAEPHPCPRRARLAAIHHPDAFLDREASGELDEAEADLLESHLAACSACRLEQAARRDFRATYPELRPIVIEPPSPGREGSGPPAKTRWRAAPLLALLGLLVLALVAARWGLAR